jgi:signal transduction histidine kinase
VLPLRPKLTDICELLRTAVERQQEQSLSHRLVLDVDSGPCLADVDPDRIEQVVENLLANAIKYTPEGGDIQVALTQGEGGIELRVRDPGIGLPPGAQERIFEPFGRAPNAIRRNIEGLGLGLYICRKIGEQHGGRLWAESAGEGRGTTMRLWLPLPDGTPVGEPRVAP